MPNIQSSTSLRNNYNDISTFCHESREPVFITKNGQGDLAVMSIEVYEMMNGKSERCHVLDEDRAAALVGRKRPYKSFFSAFEQGLEGNTQGKCQRQMEALRRFREGIRQCDEQVPEFERVNFREAEI